MNKLPLKARALILRMLCEGQSMRATARLADVSFNTVAKLLADAGAACADLHDEWVVDVPSARVQSDEIWAFRAKGKNVPSAKAAPEGAGSVWTWTALDPDTKLMVSYAVGDRSAELARLFMFDLADRLRGRRVQLTTDGFGACLKAVTDAFPGDLDHARPIELFAEPKGVTSPGRKYSPGLCTGIIKEPVFGRPDEAKIGTSHVERRNPTMRMGMRRFTRLTNGVSKKVESHAAMVALYTTSYNFVRPHKTLRMTPARAAGLTDHEWTMEEVVGWMDARAPKPAKRGPYRKRDPKSPN